MNRIARALLIALPLTLAACGQSTSESTAAKADKALTAEIPAAQEPSIAAARRYATGFDVGNLTSARRVFVFFDPQCPHCGMFWNETKALAKDARFTWVPVSLLNRASLTQGTAILGAQSPSAAMDEHEKKLLAGLGGLTAPNADPRFKDVIERNTRLLESFGASGVPYVLGVNTDTGKVFAESRGMPAAKLASQLGWTPVAGRPAQ
jgi:thiol:disulfide interchange protein DsbG